MLRFEILFRQETEEGMKPQRPVWVWIFVCVALATPGGGPLRSAWADTITPTVDGTVRDGLDMPKDGVADRVIDQSIVQILDIQRPVQPFEDRGVIEFDISTFTGSLQRARLQLRVFSSNGPFPLWIDLYTHVGDGVLSLGDFSAGTLSASFSYSGETSVELDVTSFLLDLRASGDPLAGFTFRAADASFIPLNGPFIAFGSLDFEPAAVLQVRTVPLPSALWSGLSALGVLWSLNQFHRARARRCADPT